MLVTIYCYWLGVIGIEHWMKTLNLGTLNGSPTVHGITYQKTVIMKIGLHYVYGMCLGCLCYYSWFIFYDRNINGLQIPIPCHHSCIQSFTVVEVCKTIHTFSYTSVLNYITVETKSLVAWQTIAGCWMPKSNKIHLTSKTTVNKINISCSGLQWVYHSWRYHPCSFI
jgi:hypothetical protein